MKIKSDLSNILSNSVKLLRFAWEIDKKTTFLFYFTAGVTAFVPIISSYFLKLLIDELQFAQGAFTPNIPVIVVVVLAAGYLIESVSRIVYWGFNMSYLDYIFRYKLQNAITLKFHKKISKLDIGYFEDPKVQDLISKTRETMQWRIPDQLRTFSFIFSNLIAYVTAFFVLFPFGWWIPFLITIFTIPRLYLQAKHGAIQWSMWGSGAPQVRKLWYLNYTLQEPLTVQETRISQSSVALLKKFKKLQDQLFSLNKKALDRYLKVLTLPPVIELILLFVIGYFFINPVLIGALSIGSFTLLLSMLNQLGDRASNASADFASIYEANLYVNHYFELMALPTLIKTPKKPVVFENIIPPRIEFKDVSFRYEDGPYVLKDLNFVIEPGESIAFVGHNGAGKTTIIKLLCRFYDVTSGEILINGINIKQLDLKNWYKFLGTLFQEFVRYHFSVRDNITLGSPDRKDEQAMVDAAQKAGALDFILKLPRQFDTYLGKEFEDGEELSGGQWQKLAIARAFYEEPPVLILDEPTSAIDAEAEYQIFTNLEKQYKNKTLILVSHRFSTVRNANRIFVIEDGKIRESGSHRELMQANGEYAKMFSMQAEGYK